MYSHCDHKSVPARTPRRDLLSIIFGHRRGAVAVRLIVAIGTFSLTLGAALAQVGVPTPSRISSVMDLPMGLHARELPLAEFNEFSCGPWGGQLIDGWTAWSKCQPDPDTGRREVFFRYDDEPEYWAKAHNNELMADVNQGTSEYSLLVIVSALFDADGFYVGYRLFTDPRAPLKQREKGMSLAGYLMAKFGETQWVCSDLPRRDGEAEFRGSFIKQKCRNKVEGPTGSIALSVEAHSFRKTGQAAIDRNNNLPTEGQFESSATFEALKVDAIGDAPQRLARINLIVDAPPDPLLSRARDCAGCDLRGVNLKRAKLRGAKLSGANLTGANLFGADLTGADLAGAILTDANMNRADLRQAKLAKANLQKAMLFASRFDGADLAAADMSGAMAGRIQLVRANLADALVAAVDLRNARLDDANLARANLTNSWISGALLNRTNLSGSILIYVVAREARLVGAKLVGVDARGSDFTAANLRDADLSFADFSYSRLTSVNLSVAKLDGTKFEEAELPGDSPPR